MLHEKDIHSYTPKRLCRNFLITTQPPDHFKKSGQSALQLTLFRLRKPAIRPYRYPRKP